MGWCILTVTSPKTARTAMREMMPDSADNVRPIASPRLKQYRSLGSSVEHDDREDILAGSGLQGDFKMAL